VPPPRERATDARHGPIQVRSLAPRR
jgi:hypothetical protein